ncbi:helix-turn-helix domain-containing protein, partial [Xanthomonas citri pv. citri]|nr:helix-turn-helix domain-containing protein [Xanthomonas citri pv. citri]
MLSLPEDWDYTIRGLSAILLEGERAISSTLKELEALGYLERNVLRNRKGVITDTEYIIYEQPKNPVRIDEEPPKYA